jgi:hypothetical protein
MGSKHYVAQLFLLPGVRGLAKSFERYRINVQRTFVRRDLWLCVMQSHCLCSFCESSIFTTVTYTMKFIAFLLATLSVVAAFAPAPTTVRSSTELNALFDAVSRTQG